MKKFVLVPDSFKGTLSSMQICKIIRERAIAFFPNAEIFSIPVADGGEGSVDCFLSAVGGEKIYVDCNGPYMEPVRAFYGSLSDRKTAVVEMACVAGLPMVEDRKNPLLTTTYGVGQLILAAAQGGSTRIVVGLGGSCTNDFGCGAAYACGVRFYDKNGNSFMPVGGTLKDVAQIDLSQRSPLLDGIEIVTMCDIDNPPYGKNGAAYVFAAQKGADSDTVVQLDNGVQHICDVLAKSHSKDLSELAGGGAAGAMGAGMAAFFDSQLKMGIDTVLETVGFSEIVKGADAVFTGEGKIDAQSLRGKVVIGVAREAKRAGVPVIAIVGGAEGVLSEAYTEGLTAIFTINRLPQDLSVSQYRSAENLAFAVDNIFRTMKAFHSGG